MQAYSYMLMIQDGKMHVRKRVRTYQQWVAGRLTVLAGASGLKIQMGRLVCKFQERVAGRLTELAAVSPGS